MRFVFRVLLKVFIFCCFVILFCNAWVIATTRSVLLETAEDIDGYGNIALVLGTSKSQVGGGDNLFFTNRIDATAALYRSKKVNQFVLSGDNETAYYNEPKDMQKALLKKGVPDSMLVLDNAGVRTLDSVVRCKNVFGHKKFMIVTQKFHAYRAAFIAKHYGVDVSVFLAPDPDYDDITNVLLREILARTYAVFDLYFFNTQPKYADEKLPANLG